MIKTIVNAILKGVLIGVLIGSFISNMILIDRYNDSTWAMNRFTNEVLLYLDVMKMQNHAIKEGVMTVLEDTPKKLKEFNDTMALQDESIEMIIQFYSILGSRMDLLVEQDLIDYEDKAKAVVQIDNISNDSLGTGTVIKLGNKYYILTAAHIVVNSHADIQAKFNTDVFGHDTIDYPVKVVKMDRVHDLALLSIPCTPKYYEGVGTDAPDVGDKLYVLGYPYSNVDVLTSGILCRKTGREYQMTCRVFPGSSGSSVFYKGKIVGIVRSLSYARYGVTNGNSSTLEVLEDFLYEYTSLEDVYDDDFIWVGGSYE